MPQDVPTHLTPADGGLAPVRRPLDGVKRWLSAPLLALLWLYQKLARPLMPPTCRFFPSCSDYAVDAVKLYGPFKGTALAARRVSRCHPFHPGGFDPVPGSDLDKPPAPRPERP